MSSLTNRTTFERWSLDPTAASAPLAFAKIDNDDLVEILKCLSEMEKLKTLILTGNRISTLPPLGLVKLLKLNLEYNQIEGIEALESLVSLTHLYLGGGSNQISNLQPLRRLVRLEVFVLGGNQLADVEPLSSLVNLRMLILGGKKITDVEPLGNLINLSVLNLMENQITGDEK